MGTWIGDSAWTVKISVASSERGDIQTHIDLARQVVRRFNSDKWGRVFEPTCETDNFLEVSILSYGAPF